MTKVDMVVKDDRTSIRRILQVLANGLTVSDNLSVAQVDVADTGDADVEFVVQHNLGRKPVGYVWNISTSGTVYDGDRSGWTATQLTLRCSAANAQIHLLIL